MPKTGVVAGVYVQAISAFAPHPNAAKLWMEYLYSDEGQLGWLKGYCHPIRFNDLAKNGKIPQELLDKLPPAAAYEAAVFPTLDEQGAAKEVITKQWDTRRRRQRPVADATVHRLRAVPPARGWPVRAVDALQGGIAVPIDVRAAMAPDEPQADIARLRRRSPRAVQLGADCPGRGSASRRSSSSRCCS